MTQSKARTSQLTVISVAVLICLASAFVATAGEPALSNDDARALKEISTLLLTPFEITDNLDLSGTTPGAEAVVEQMGLSECELAEIQCEGGCFRQLVQCKNFGGYGCFDAFDACVYSCQQNSNCTT